MEDGNRTLVNDGLLGLGLLEVDGGETGIEALCVWCVVGDGL